MACWNFKNRAKTELCLAHYRVLRGMALVTWRDVVSGTTRKQHENSFPLFLRDQVRKLCCGRAKKEIMPDRCVAANCGNIKDKERNISMHRFPFYGDTRPEAQKRRKRWVDWVKLKRAKWEPSVHSYLCSVHFKPEEFMFQFGNEVDLSNKWLQRDELGVCVFPSIHSGAKEKPISARDKRMVR